MNAFSCPFVEENMQAVVGLGEEINIVYVYWLHVKERTTPWKLKFLPQPLVVQD